MKILILDNYDSFTFNLAYLLKRVTDASIQVRRNDKILLDEVSEFDRIVLSPGPGLPSEAGIMPDLVRRYGSSKRILGVCLGHQCIGELFGGTLVNMSEVCHGKGIETVVSDPGEPIFAGIPGRFVSGRYHSWMISPEGLPSCLKVIAHDEAGCIMGLRHREFDLSGVQFHPESVLTEHGESMLRNWVK